VSIYISKAAADNTRTKTHYTLSEKRGALSLTQVCRQLPRDFLSLNMKNRICTVRADQLSDILPLYAPDPLNNNLKGTFTVTSHKSNKDIGLCDDEVDLTHLLCLAYKGYAQKEERGLLIKAFCNPGTLYLCIISLCGDSKRPRI
jgi:hypothetical protein